MKILVFVISTVGLGLLCSLPGVLAGKYLAKKGLAKDQSIWVVTGEVFAMFLARLMLPSVPLAYIVTLAFVLSPIGVYRHDLWTTFRRGKRWWSKDNSEEIQPMFNLPISIVLSIIIGCIILFLVFGALSLTAHLLY